MVRSFVIYALAVMLIAAERTSAEAEKTLAPACPTNFALMSDQYCIHINTETYDGVSPALTWAEARRKCQAMAPSRWISDLAILKTEEKLKALSKTMVDNYADMSTYVWWVGARQINIVEPALWLWSDDTVVDLYSYVWHPSFPVLDTTDNTAYLIPAGESYYRLHMAAQSRNGGCPSFVCEATAV